MLDGSCDLVYYLSKDVGSKFIINSIQVHANCLEINLELSEMF